MDEPAANGGASTVSPKKKIPLVYHPTASSASKRSARHTTPFAASINGLSLSATQVNFGSTPGSPNGNIKVSRRSSNTQLTNIPWDEVRDHEILCMKYEDDRRRIALSQKKQLEQMNGDEDNRMGFAFRSVAPPKQEIQRIRVNQSAGVVLSSNMLDDEEDDFVVPRPGSSASNFSHVGGNNDHPTDKNTEHLPTTATGIKVAEADVIAAIQALSNRTTMKLVSGRKENLFDWCVNTIVLSATANDYELTWYPVNSTVKDGSISLSDIILMNLKEDILHITVSTTEKVNTKALKKSGGRPIISIRCENSNAAIILQKHLDVLKTILI